MTKGLARLAILIASLWLASARDESPCNSARLSASLSDRRVTLINVTNYANNTYELNGASNNVPFCAVDASIAYGKNDSLLFSLWLPHESTYKARFIAVGNGGMAGVIDHSNMLTQLNSGMGFAVAGGNAGHLASDNNNGLGQPGVYLPYLHHRKQVKAWIHNAVSLFAPVARATASSFYKSGVSHAYYIGCK